jgi:regulator of sigma E protease
MNLLPDFVPALLTIIVFLMVVSVVHDLGQMLVARWCGVRTRWRFVYVQLLEEFRAKPLMARAAIIAAGPIANTVLAIVLLAVTYLQSGTYVAAARVDELVAGGAAAKAGFRVGDLIISIDGRRIESFAEMQSIVGASPDRELVFAVDRGGVVTRVKAMPTRRETTDRLGNKQSVGVIGIRRNPNAELTYKSYGPIEYVGVAVNDGYRIVSGTPDYPTRVEPAAKGQSNPVLVILGAFLRAIAPYLNLIAVLSVGMGVVKLVLSAALSLLLRPRSG